jgi:hypothetical protein
MNRCDLVGIALCVQLDGVPEGDRKGHRDDERPRSKTRRCREATSGRPSALVTGSAPNDLAAAIACFRAAWQPAGSVCRAGSPVG